MIETARTPTAATDEAVDRALAAAEAAADAAAEAQAAARAAALPPAAHQDTAPVGRWPLVLGGVGAICGLLTLGAAGLIYLRAVSDLHDAAQVQAKAAGMLIDQIGALSGLGQAIAPDTLLRKADAAALQADLAARMPPAPDLAPLRHDLMAAISELKMDLDAMKAGPADSAELTTMLADTLRRLEALAQPATARAAPPARPAPTAAPKAAPRKPAVQASPSPFSFE